MDQQRQVATLRSRAMGWRRSTATRKRENIGPICVNGRDVLLIVALSSRALAQSSRRARLTPVAIDAFGDEDARAACAELTVASGAAEGFAGVDLDALVGPLVRAFAPKGIVYGSGFEDCPDQLRRLAKHAPLLGASPATVAAAKDPVCFADLCAAFGLSHPEIATVRPFRPEKWLLKRAGGSGGLHIRSGEVAEGPGDYWQMRVEGDAVSLLFTRDVHSLVPVAWSEQWTSPTDLAPYRYGGAAGPLERQQEPGILDALAELTERLGLRGVASADFLDDGERLWLLEINPRPGATLDVFDSDADPLILRHLSALTGRARPAPMFRRPAAAAVFYAPRRLVSPAWRWPAWAADQPKSGTVIPEGAPFCTVRAEGETLAGAKDLLSERVQRLYEAAERYAA